MQNTWTFGGDQVGFEFAQYHGGATAVQAWTSYGEPYAKISVNIAGAPILPAGQFYLKDWNENGPIAKAMRVEGLIEPTGAYIGSGHNATHAYQFTAKGLAYVKNPEEASHEL